MPKDGGIRLQKASNLLRLAIDLASTAEGLTLDEIAARFDVNRRTAERMRDAIRDLFPGLEAIPDGPQLRFRIKGGLSSFMNAPTTSELAELESVTRTLVQSGYDARATLLLSLQAKIRAALSERSRRSMAPDLEALTRAEAIARQVGPKSVTDSQTLAMLRQALLEMKCIRFNYLGRSDLPYQRTVVPYGLLFGRYAFLVGRESHKEEPVLWRLDRLDNLELTDEVGAPPPLFSLDDFAARSFGTFQEPAEDVVLRFAPSAATAARKMMFHPTQSQSDLPDGSLEVRFHAGALLEMVYHLFTWGSTVEILEPPALRELMITELKKSLARHEEASENP